MTLRTRRLIRVRRHRQRSSRPSITAPPTYSPTETHIAACLRFEKCIKHSSVFSVVQLLGCCSFFFAMPHDYARLFRLLLMDSDLYLRGIIDAMGVRYARVYSLGGFIIVMLIYHTRIICTPFRENQSDRATATLSTGGGQLG
jgi:hypothetical protein